MKKKAKRKVIKKVVEKVTRSYNVVRDAMKNDNECCGYLLKESSCGQCGESTTNLAIISDEPLCDDCEKQLIEKAKNILMPWKKLKMEEI
jgi:hypothetical protein